MKDTVKGARIEPLRGAVPVYGCGCTDHPHDTVFFSSVRRETGGGYQHAALSGPYLSHADALAAVPADRTWAIDDSGDPRACWYGYGTFSALRDNTIRPLRN